MEKVRPKPVRFTLEEVDFLEEAYQKGSKVACVEAKPLAESLGCEKDRIVNWFRKRRKKDNITKPAIPDFTDHQKEQLEIAYQKSCMPARQVLREMAKRLEITDVERVVRWFARQRGSRRAPNMQIFSQEQTEHLISIYAKKKYPTKKELNKIAGEFGTTTTQIHAWFMTERAKQGVTLTRKKLAVLTSTTTKLLEAAFAENPKPKILESQKIMENTKIDKHTFTTWFARKRRSLAITGKSKCTIPQQNALEEAYQNNKYLSIKEVNELGDRIGMQHLRVQRWFHYHRTHDEDFDKDNVILPRRKQIEASARCILNEAYQENKYLSSQEMYALADRAGLKQSQVNSWFSSRRSKLKDGKTRTYITADQHRSLQAAYQINARPTKEEREKLATKVGLLVDQVTCWYFHTRAKLGCPHVQPPLTTKQRDILLDAYKENRYPRARKFAEIANSVGLTEMRVRNWFTYSRTKQKRLKAANLPQVKQEEANLQGIEVKIKMEPTDVELGDVK